MHPLCYELRSDLIELPREGMREGRREGTREGRREGTRVRELYFARSHEERELNN